MAMLLSVLCSFCVVRTVTAARRESSRLQEPDFAIKPGYKCELQAKAWCTPPAVNPGQQYRKNGKVMCCSKLEATEAPPKEETTTEAPPEEETTTEAVVEPEEPDFAIKPGYKCELQATAWCTPPAVNPGQQYRKNGKVMCCSKLEATEAPPKEETTTEAPPKEETTTEAVVEPEEPDFAIKPGYKCELQAKAWCAPPAVNPGQQYRKNGKVMCCSKLEVTEALTAESPLERESPEDSSEVTPKEETTTEAPPKEETTTQTAVEPEEPDFAIKPGYKCELQAKAWCTPPAVNPGQQYRKNGKVMCCIKTEKTEEADVVTSTTTTSTTTSVMMPVKSHVPTTDEEDIATDIVVVTSTTTMTTTTSVMVPIQPHLPRTDDEAEDTVVLTSATTKTTTTADTVSLPSPLPATDEGSEARSYGPRMERLLEALVAVGNAAARVEESIHHEAKVPMKESFIEAPTEESSAEAAVEPQEPDLETKPGYKCMMYAKAWCTYPEVNPGDKYHKNGKVKCCTKIDQPEAPRKKNPTDAVVDENSLKTEGFGTKAQWNVLDEEADSPQKEDEEEEPEEMTPTTPVPRDEEKMALCGEFEFQSETFMRRGKPVTVCRNKDTGRFAKALCCK